MNFLKKYLKASIISALLFANTTACLAANLSDSGNLLTKMGRDTGYNTEVTTEGMIGSIIQIFLSLLGVIFLILMLYGGYLWMTDRGNDDSVKKAKNVIQAAIIGLAIVLASYAITYFIVSKFGDSALAQ